MSLPDDFIKRIRTQEGVDAGELIKALGEPSPVSIRLNNAKWDRVPVNALPVPWCSNGYYLEERPSFTADPLFHSGCYYPQEASSMFLGEVIRQNVGQAEGIRILDLCGAPGGKSTHLSASAGKDSFIVSNEVIRQRAAVLAETVTKWGIGNVMITQSDPGAFGRIGPYFDIIVIDAPCSGEGMFRNPVAVNEWSEANAALCSDRQKRILSDAWPALKEDGLLVYSTCTFNPDENEKNISWLLKNQKAECLPLNISQFPRIKEIDFEGIYGYGFYPGKIAGEGFFISVIRKKQPAKEIRIKPGKTTHLLTGKNEAAAAMKLASFPADRLLKKDGEITAIPCSPEHYLFLYDNLRIIKPGTRLLGIKKNGFMPLHDMALSTAVRKEAFPRKELTHAQSVSFMRRDNFMLDGLVKGWNILTYSDVNLGFVNNIGNRFNNYYPVEWRIRMNVTGAEKQIGWQ
jgi:16S rRNA C967 or C1407 C5-methylase (RsmB/RsmF family)/NOL1/NOP2/fmu family ribosome biogenesis protein